MMVSAILLTLVCWLIAKFEPSLLWVANWKTALFVVQAEYSVPQSHPHRIFNWLRFELYIFG